MVTKQLPELRSEVRPRSLRPSRSTRLALVRRYLQEHLKEITDDSDLFIPAPQDWTVARLQQVFAAAAKEMHLSVFLDHENEGIILGKGRKASNN